MNHKILSIVFTAALLAACSTKFKEKVGVVTTGPDEYKVQTGKPLDVPPNYNLPTPKESNADSKKG